MQFGFINSLAMFQKRINTVLQEYLDEFVITYLNNNNIYLDNKDNYINYIK